uniref:Uncharacterized protein n=2 Tax=Arion vulgaris TaxID=1028688 RepID=A0A0B6ZLY1_9EUPU
MLSLSLCFCDLGVDSGKYLGHTVSTTAIRELFLDGNELQCEGAIELIKLCVDQAEIEAYQREEEEKKKTEEEELKAEKDKQSKYDGISGRDGSASEKDDNSASEKKGIKKKKKGKGKKKKKKSRSPPPVGPWLHKLHLADNGIDGFGDGGSFAPIICMRLFKKLIMNSKCLQELDLEDNTIGELGSREIMDGLKYRKEIKLGGCKVRTTHTITVDTFGSIIKFGNKVMKKGKRKRKKGKKKK